MVTTPSSRERPLAVAEVVRMAGRSLDDLGLLWLEGELTQLSRPASGHLYFSLRDQTSVLPGVLWARDAARLRFVPEAGQRLRVRGRLGVYDRDGKMQLYADFAEPAGQGNAALALALLKEKLAAEGLFAAERKRPLPRFPRRIGVVTSKSGAAVHDIIRTVQRRFPTPLLIADCAVQGPMAPRQIMAAMAMAVRAGVDVLIVGRGGGAVTDLSAFNAENVVRTVARCPVPVISAVGHEVDLSLCDLAADARASTPTAAAELAVPVAAEIQAVLDKERRRLDREVRVYLERARLDLDKRQGQLASQLDSLLARRRGALGELERRLLAAHPRQQLGERRTALHAAERELERLSRARFTQSRLRLRELEQRLAQLSPRLAVAQRRGTLGALVARREAALRGQLAQRRGELASLMGQLAALSPLAVLERGYAVARTPDGKLVRHARALRPGMPFELHLHGGVVRANVEAVHLEPASAEDEHG